MQLLGIIIMQALTLFQPEALLETRGGGRIVSVEMARQETRVRLHHEDSLTLPAGTYLSDEADRHYALQRIEREGGDRVYIFNPIPTTTRIFDIIAERQRWMGVHSAIRSVRFPVVRQKYDDSAVIPDSINQLIHDVSLEAFLDDEEWYHAVKSRLPLYRDYVAWKWQLSPHAVFLLRRLQERIPQTVASSISPISSKSSATFIPYSEPQRPRRRNFFQRLFGRSKRTELPVSPDVPQQKPRPLSRFEQKMLQESRTRGN
ncbi:MAG: hypothetical protein IJQ59_02290 [Bacteroidaceae bacterium]|nr:hypothetical protein [Bacteroidaceae bacterium]